jgi:hypothetical protein
VEKSGAHIVIANGREPMACVGRESEANLRQAFENTQKIILQSSLWMK